MTISIDTYLEYAEAVGLVPLKATRLLRNMSPAIEHADVGEGGVQEEGRVVSRVWG